jgi:hypothetical protein
MAEGSSFDPAIYQVTRGLCKGPGTFEADTTGFDFY